MSVSLMEYFPFRNKVEAEKSKNPSAVERTPHEN